MSKNNKPSSLPILAWAEEDRPREKLMQKGRSVLSNAELIAILIGSGTTSLSAVEVAKKILSKFGNDLDKLARASIKELTEVNGIGEAKAISIIAAFEVGRRRKEANGTDDLTITGPESVYKLMTPDLADLQTEEFWVLFLNKRNVVIKKEKISAGGIDGTAIDVRVVLKFALENLATGIILVHNHPAGTLKPSDNDKNITKRIKSAAEIMNISVLDHLIYTNRGYYSFSENQLL